MAKKQATAAKTDNIGDKIYSQASNSLFRTLLLSKLVNTFGKSLAFRIFLRLLFSKFNPKVALQDPLPIFKFAISITLSNLVF